MDINTWIDFSIYTIFTLGVFFVGLPMGISFTFVAIKFLIKQNKEPYKKRVNTEYYGKNPLETLFVGLFTLSGSIWYLLFDREGHLKMYFENVSIFFGTN